MGLKETTTTMIKLLDELNKNVLKAVAGNKAASQRVRTGTIKLEKIAKTYRKESVAAEKKNLSKRTPLKAKTSAKKAVKKTKKKK